MEGTVGLMDIVNTLKKRWKLIMLIILSTAFISGSVSYFLLTPVYQASTQILVNQKNPENRYDYNSLQGNVDLIKTYSDIIKSPAILGKVINQLQLNESVDDLNKAIRVDNQENSQVFSLIVENQDATKAVEIANIVSTTFQQEIKGIMNVDNVSIIAQAELKDNPVPVKPKPILYISIAILVGMFIGCGTALLVELMDNTLKDEQDAAMVLGLPVLGSVQKMQKSDKSGVIGSLNKQMGSETIVS